MSKRLRKVRKQNHKKQIQKPTERPQFSFKKLVKVIGVTIGVTAEIVTIVAGIFAYLELIHPRLSVSLDQIDSNIFNANFITANEGYFFTLFDVEVRVRVYQVVVPNRGLPNMELFGEGVFKTPMSDLGNIPPKNSLTFPFTVLQASSWEKASICVEVNFTVDPFWGVKRFSETQRFGFQADRKFGTDRWIRRSCEKLARDAPRLAE